MPASYALLEDRGVLAIMGEDAETFLQGLVSVDVTKASGERALYGALLTPQGKFLFDFFLLRMDAAFYLESEGARIEELKKRLSLYKLRAKVSIEDATEKFRVFAFFGEGAVEASRLPEEAGAARFYEDGLLYVDPRTAKAGTRALLPNDGTVDVAGFAKADAADYDRFRITLGLPDGSRDLEPEKAVLLDYGFDALNGIDWEKGCYVGQEVTARMKHRGLARKGLFPVTIEGAPPAPGTAIAAGGRDVGMLTSVRGDVGLALLKHEAIEAGDALQAGAARLSPRR
ncbi:MAG: folate-binding protein YgfZ [Alphaproteobacteria bacterium]|nr:folate-binding protein YgfZ [Alphaproteobacteria bacterium]